MKMEKQKEGKKQNKIVKVTGMEAKRRKGGSSMWLAKEAVGG